MSSGASLNHIFRTVWNQALGTMVAVAETDNSADRSSGNRSKSVALHRPPEVGVGLLAFSVALAWGALASSSHANPTGGVAIVGQATVVNNGNAMQVTTQNGVGGNFSTINWQSFSIPAGSSTLFQQPNAASTSINRVVTNTPSQLFGSLSSNGNLVLVNQAGIVVGTGAVVDTAGFTASSLAMTDADAMAGRLRFGNGSASTSNVAVNGTILARTGDVVVLGSGVQTGKDALVQAPNGSTILAAGQQIDITGRGLEGISLQVQAPSNAAVNLGMLKGGAVGMFAGTLKHSGLIQAGTAALEGGRVVLKASADTYIEGQGSVLANSAAGAGGFVQVLGNRVALTDNAHIDVSGATSGGTILVGGDYQGKNAAVQNANMTYVGKDTQLNANATGNGNGGKVIVWADDTTRAYGSFNARGGQTGGDGGFVETSGKSHLDFQGRVNTTAVAGKNGVLLLDPSNIVISTAADQAVTGSTPFVGSSGTSVLNEITLNNALLSSAVVVDASGGTGGSGNITVSSSVSSSSHDLTLKAGPAGTIAINAPITTMANLFLIGGSGGITQLSPLTVSGNADFNSGTGDITLQNAGNDFQSVSLSGGAIRVRALSDLTVLALSNGLNKAVDLNAGADLTLPPAVINTGTANLSLTSSSSLVTPGAALSGANVTLSSVGGNVTLNGPISALGGTISLSAPTGTVQDDGPGQLTANALTVVAGGSGNVNLANANNKVNSLTATITGSNANQSSYWNNGALSLGPITAAGGLNLKSYGGAITQSGVITTSLNSSNSIDSGVGGITLLNSSNSFHNLDIAAAGVVKIADSSAALSLSNINSTSLDVRTSGALNILGPLTAAAGGNVILGAEGQLSGSGGSVAVSGGGRWLAYLPSNVDCGSCTHTFPLGAQFVQYNYVSPGSTPIPASGNGAIFTNINPATLMGALTGTVSKVYDGSTTINLSGASFSGTYMSGFQDSFSPTVDPFSVSVTGNGTLSNANVGTGILVAASPGAKVGGIPGTMGALGSVTAYGYQLNASTSGNIGNVTAAPVSVSVSLSGSRAYDGTNIVNANIFSIGGLMGADTLTLAGAGTVVDKNVGVNKPVSLGSLALGNGTALASNYTFTGGNHVASISPALLSVTDSTRIYNGTNLINASLLSLSGLVGGETLGLSGNGTVADQNVGNNKALSLGNLVLSNGSGLVSNYSFGGGPYTASITPAVISVIGGTRAYDGTNLINASLLSVGGLVGGETLGLMGIGTVSDKNVGIGKPVSLATLALVNGTGLATNYQLSSLLPKATITAKQVVPTAIFVDNKIYDGSVIATLTGGQISGSIAGDSLSVGGTGSFADKNVGTGKTVTSGTLALTGSDSGNYTLTPDVLTAFADITAKPIDISGLTAKSREYNGKLNADANLSGAALSGLIAGDVVALTSAQGEFTDKNVGIGKPVAFNAFELGGVDSSNYKVASANSANAEISVRALSSWIGSVGGLWSDPANWDALPDGNNVLAVNIPSGLISPIQFDYSYGGVTLQSLTSGSGIVVANGSLIARDSFTSTGYTQTGGSVSGSGAFKVNGIFNQSGGALAFASVDAVQTSGDLNVNSINAASVVLTAQNGAIRQTGGIQSASLTTSSTAGTYLNCQCNQLSAFDATNKGAGNIELVNTGALNLKEVFAQGGGIQISNTGAIDTTGLVSAGDGTVALTANSPLKIGPKGVLAKGDIQLTATNLTSTGNMSLDGPIESTAGGVSIDAANNLTQNSSILAALGVRVSVGGVLTLGPLASAGYQPVSYIVNKQPLSPPRPPESASVAVAQIVSLMQTNMDLGSPLEPNPMDLLLRPSKERDLSRELIVSEGQICRP